MGILISDPGFAGTTYRTTETKDIITIKMAGNVPKKQMAQVVEQTGKPVVYKKIPVQKPGPDEVLVNIKFSGVCHTDLHAVNGDWPLATKLPLVGGHEGAGVVVAKGDLVEDIEIGEHAGVKWINGTCLACDFCQQADEPLCPKPLLSGYTVDGTFQQYCIAKAAHVARIPKECDLAAIAPVLCAGITVYKGLKESGVKPGQFAAIVGAGGGLGSLACQYAKAMGVRVIGIDTGDEKKKMVTELGAESFVDFLHPRTWWPTYRRLRPTALVPTLSSLSLLTRSHSNKLLNPSEPAAQSFALVSPLAPTSRPPYSNL